MRDRSHPSKLRKTLLRVFSLSVASALIGCASVSPSVTEPACGTPRVELPNTFVHKLPVEGAGHEHQVWVHVPLGYAQTGHKFPVVFVTDANYGFPLVRAISNRVGKRGQNIEEFVLVGLPHEPGISSHDSRSRDYTPTNPLNDPNRKASDYTAAMYGEAQAYQTYIERQVFPMLAKQYRVDLKRTVYMGQSYGGLFGAFTLLTNPSLFQTYLLGSPSLWFDRRAILKFEDAYAAKHKDLNARVKMYTGSYEAIKPGPRYPKEFDLTADVAAFEKLLKSRNYPNLRLESEVIDEEDHMTVGPSFITRGLLWALPGRGPYNGE